MRNQRTFGTSKQEGMVLVISLIILLVLTLIGVTGMQTTTLQEKMAGNTRDRSLAFQSAEAALRDAEAYLDTIVSTANFGNGANGLYDANNDPDYKIAATWTNGARAYPDAVTGNNPIIGVSSQPQYFIKEVGMIPGPAAPLNLGPGYGGRQPGANITLFRITARSSGGTDTAHVYLRSDFGRRF